MNKTIIFNDSSKIIGSFLYSYINNINAYITRSE